MQELFDFLLQVCTGILDWLGIIGGFFADAFQMAQRALSIAWNVVPVFLNIPKYFEWLPASCTAILLTVFQVVIFLRVLSIIRGK